jgi:hypothetical protein
MNNKRPLDLTCHEAYICSKTQTQKLPRHTGVFKEEDIASLIQQVEEEDYLRWSPLEDRTQLLFTFQGGLKLNFSNSCADSWYE